MIEFPSLNQVAADNGVAPGLLRARAGRERWRAQRQAFLDRLERERQEQRAVDAAAEAWAADQAALDAACAGLQAIYKRLTELEAGGGQGRALARELRDLAKVAGQWQHLPPAEPRSQT